MQEYNDPAWDEYLSTGEDPTGGELEDYDNEEVEEVEAQDSCQTSGYGRPSQTAKAFLHRESNDRSL